MISCKEASELLSQSQDRALSLRERLGLRFHLLYCAGCRNFRRQMEVLRAACQRMSGRD
jgi:hypothetical protein